MSDAEFERRLSSAMRAPVSTSARARSAVMDRVRAEAKREMPRRGGLAMGGRNLRHSVVGLAMAAGVGSLTTLSLLGGSSAATVGGGVASAVIGDTVVASLHDTLRLVRLMFDAPGARHVALAGDFNGWRADATPMRRDERSSRWTVTVPLRDGEYRYAVLVDDARSRTGDVRDAGRAQPVTGTLRVARDST